MRFCFSLAAVALLSVSMAARADSFKIFGSGTDDIFCQRLRPYPLRGLMASVSITFRSTKTEFT